MPTYTFNSSPPSTPGSGQKPKPFHFGAHPSTTPAGPPPSSSKSFTPIGAPPSTVFGSSRLGNGDSLFGNPRASNLRPANVRQQGGLFETRTYTSKLQLNDVAQESDQDMDGDADGEEDEEIGMELEYQATNRHDSEYMLEDPYDWAAHGSSVHGGGLGKSVQPQPSNSMSLIRTNDSTLPTAAKQLAARLGKAELTESDWLILETEKQVNKMYKEGASPKLQDMILEAALKEVPQVLCKLWESCCNEIDHTTDEIRGESSGPLEDDPGLYKATFVGGLLLKLNHLPTRKRISSPQKYNMRPEADSIIEEAYPKMLIDWLDANHNPYRTVTTKLQFFQPNPTASGSYWDLLISSALRGQLNIVRSLLDKADFTYAYTAKEEGLLSKGYKGSQLEVIRLVISRASVVIGASPALMDGDWHITSEEWKIYRKEVEKTLSDLRILAEGENYDDFGRSTMRAENFGLSTASSALSLSTRKAQSKIPWAVYEGLKSLYSIIAGSSTEIINSAQDWLEATLALSIWWDGNDNENLTASTTSMRNSRRLLRGPRLVDTEPVNAYRRQIVRAFAMVTEEDTLQVDANNSVEVAIASILEGNIQDALSLLRCWSIPITAAIMEVGTEAQWYESIPPESGDGLDESDLMVLSYAQPERPISKDSVLIEYAELIFDRPIIGESKLEGWEFSVELLGRVDEVKLATKKIGVFLNKLFITDDEKANKVISICRNYELFKEACEIAEVCWKTFDALVFANIFFF
jgi:hypothetical protein